MNRESPTEGQRVEVRIGQGTWQPATFRRGQFIDIYGLVLDPLRVSEWQAQDPLRETAPDALH